MHTAVCLCVCVCMCVCACAHTRVYVMNAHICLPLSVPGHLGDGVPRIKIIVVISIAPYHTDKGECNALNLLLILSVSHILDYYLLIIC